LIETEIVRQRDFRIKPELRLTACTGDMDMHSRLLAREEIETEAALLKDRRIQKTTLDENAGHDARCV